MRQVSGIVFPAALILAAIAATAELPAAAQTAGAGHPRKDGKRQILFIEITDDQGHHFAEKPGTGGD